MKEDFDDPREFATYLRRLADEIDHGRARGEYVLVQHADRERTHEIEGQYNKDHVRVIDTGETHEFRVRTLRRVGVRQCKRCGVPHEDGMTCRDQMPARFTSLVDYWS